MTTPDVVLTALQLHQAAAGGSTIPLPTRGAK